MDVCRFSKPFIGVQEVLLQKTLSFRYFTLHFIDVWKIFAACINLTLDNRISEVHSCTTIVCVPLNSAKVLQFSMFSRQIQSFGHFSRFQNEIYDNPTSVSLSQKLFIIAVKKNSTICYFCCCSMFSKQLETFITYNIARATK